LPPRPLFIEPVDPLNVERRRCADAANDMVNQDAGVLEEPGQKDDGEGNAHQAGVGGQCQERREHENQDRGWAEEVGIKPTRRLPEFLAQSACSKRSE